MQLKNLAIAIWQPCLLYAAALLFVRRFLERVPGVGLLAVLQDGLGPGEGGGGLLGGDSVV